MMFKLKNVFLLTLLLLGSFVGWKTYIHFFDKSQPILLLSGIEHEGYYCDNLQCIISSNKKGSLSIWLDKKPLMRNFKLISARQEYPFTIPTRTLANGKHSLKIEVSDNTYNKNKQEKSLLFYIDNVPLQAAFIKPETEFRVLQGRTMHIQFQVNKKIKGARIEALSSSYECFPESKNSSIYEAFIPVPCEETPSEYLVSVEIKDYVGNILNLENKFQIVQFPFKKQILKLDSKKIKEERELGKTPQDFENDIKEAVSQSPKQKLWRGQFCTPIDISKTTCEFGTVRITQEKGKYIHKAVDIINDPKSVVWASQNGIVTIKERYEESGNTVIIDHGWGILSMYFHLEEFANIKVGDAIKKGNPVGTLGKTGYASGYHLHWEIRVNNIPVDPMQWVKANF